MRFQIIKMIFWLFVAIFMVSMGSSKLEAQPKALPFDDKYTYDIYLRSSDEKISVIKKVEIQRVQQVGNQTFLVIKSAGFRIREAEGFVRLEAIDAILPTDDLIMHEGQRIQKHF